MDDEKLLYYPINYSCVVSKMKIINEIIIRSDDEYINEKINLYKFDVIRCGSIIFLF